MPSSEYSSIGSGALKLKGPGGVEKKKKKKKVKATNETNLGNSTTEEQSTARTSKHEESDSKTLETGASEAAEQLADYKAKGGKTESELRFEEQRRRRLNERLKREGAKTHKERVEELNKYLSTLSEHHDMPRIGPG